MVLFDQLPSWAYKQKRHLVESDFLKLEITEQVHVLLSIKGPLGEALGQREVAAVLEVSQATVCRTFKLNGSDEVKPSGGQCALTDNEEMLLVQKIVSKIFIGDPPTIHDIFEMVSGPLLCTIGCLFTFRCCQQ